jgi:hypothetical protein
MVTGTRLISTFCPLQALERVNVQMETTILLVLVLKPLKIEVFIYIYNLKKKGRHAINILFRIEVFNSKVLVPKENVIACSNYIRMQEPLCKPPRHHQKQKPSKIYLGNFISTSNDQWIPGPRQLTI